MAVEFIDVALALYESHVLKKGEFVLVSGKEASTYWDVASAEHYPKHRDTIIAAYEQMFDECEPFDTLVDVFSAPSKFTAILAYKRNLSINTVREPKDHGYITAIVGDYKPGDRALVIEGVLNTGGSALSAVKTLENHGLVVQDIVGLIDIEQGARETLTGYNLHIVTTHQRLMDFYQKTQRGS